MDKMILIRDCMKPLAKTRGAKSTYGYVYKKDNDYLWKIDLIPYLVYQFSVITTIKPWKYDELLYSIINPQTELHFTDKMRCESFAAMKPYQISRIDIDFPMEANTYRTKTEELNQWCTDVFQNAISTIDDFIKMIDEQGGLNHYLIHNAEHNLLMAAFAYISCENFEQAEVCLKKAEEEKFLYNRCFGSMNRDLRDVLLDYCYTMQNGMEWTRENVLLGI